MVRWPKTLWRLVNIARGHRSPSPEALELIYGLHLQNVEACQIAANLNMLKILPPDEEIWTEDAVKAAMAFLKDPR